MTRVGLIGFGAIGRSIIDLWRAESPRSFAIAGVCARSNQVEQARSALPQGSLVCESVEELVAAQPNSIIEAAGHAVVRSHGAYILKQGVSLYLLSVGALAEPALRTALIAAAQDGGSRILIPAGALAGFDGLLTLACDRLRSVKYTSTKPSRAWEGTTAIEKHNLERLTHATVIFAGSAGEAARLFPKNANLAASVALAGMGFEKTRVELIADPRAQGNTGVIEAVSDTTTITLTVASHPSDNPKTSANVGASVIAALRNGASVIRFV